MHLYIHIITLSLTHLHFSAFISAVIHHYLMLLAFIWQELIIDSVIVKDCWQTDFITVSVILDTTWLLPSFPTSCILDKIKSTCLIKWTLIQVSLDNFVTDFSFFLTTWVITPSLPWVTKMLLSLMFANDLLEDYLYSVMFFMTWFPFTWCGLIFLWISFHESENLKCLLRFIFVTLRRF